MKKIPLEDINLVGTSTGFPEQYDAYYRDKQVGYLRLRHGSFTVAFPDCGYNIIYQGWPEGDGEFETIEERTYYLEKAKEAIIEQLPLFL